MPFFLSGHPFFFTIGNKTLLIDYISLVAVIFETNHLFLEIFSLLFFHVFL